MKDVLPADIFQKRFWWPRPANRNLVTTADNLKVLAAMTHTVELIWTDRQSRSQRKYVARGFRFHIFTRTRRSGKNKSVTLTLLAQKLCWSPWRIERPRTRARMVFLRMILGPTGMSLRRTQGLEDLPSQLALRLQKLIFSSFTPMSLMSHPLLWISSCKVCLDFLSPMLKKWNPILLQCPRTSCRLVLLAFSSSVRRCQTSTSRPLLPLRTVLSRWIGQHPSAIQAVLLNCGDEPILMKKIGDTGCPSLSFNGSYRGLSRGVALVSRFPVFSPRPTFLPDIVWSSQRLLHSVVQFGQTPVHFVTVYLFPNAPLGSQKYLLNCKILHWAYQIVASVSWCSLYFLPCL